MKKLSLLIFLLLARHAQAQFRPYSLYPLSPVLTNPALVAADDYGQVTAHYRQSRVAGYQVPSLSYVHPFYGKAGGNRYGGMGFALINQSAGPAALYQVTGAMGGLGYHLAPGPHHALDAGLQLGLINKRIAPGAITTDAQFGAGGFDPTLPTGELPDGPGRTAVALNAGLHWSCADRAGRRKASLGLALHNANRPAYPFLGERNREPVGYVVTGSFRAAGRGNFSAEPTFRYFLEGPTALGSVGAQFGYALGDRKETKVSATLWYHTNVSPGLGLQLETKGFVLGFGADGSSYRNATMEPGNNAYEVALAWRINRKKRVDDRRAGAEPPPAEPVAGNQPLPSPAQPAEATAPPVPADSAATPSSPSPAREEEKLARQLAYPLGGTTLSAGDEQFLDSLARELKAHPDWQLRIGGHTCSLGSPPTNANVSRARAQAVQARLVQKGVPAAQLRATGHADRYPVAPNDTEAGRARNRRVEFVLVK